LLIVFIDALGRSIVSESVIVRVGKELDDAISELSILTDASQAPQADLPSIDASWQSLGRGGYIQSIDFPALVGRARQLDLAVEFNFQPGDSVAPVGCHSRCLSGIAEDVLKLSVDDLVQIGPQRTPFQ